VRRPADGARLVQAQANANKPRPTYRTQRRIAVARRPGRINDILHKYDSFAPSMRGDQSAVRAGETVVPVFKPDCTEIMTIADMSLITAEVKVDETDIVNVKLDRQPKSPLTPSQQDLQGHVTEMGNTAILRSTGVAASQSAISSQEAKDFKVVIALDNPPDEIRPGLSCTAKITTATVRTSLLFDPGVDRPQKATWSRNPPLAPPEARRLPSPIGGGKGA